MCDYSLQGIRNRLAEEGETLVVHRFSTGSKGLTSATEGPQACERPKGWLNALKWLFATPAQECAVCIPDGARLLVPGLADKLWPQHGIKASDHVVFRQLSEEAAVYRDAVEFSCGAKVRIQELEDGQIVEVCALSSQDTETLLEEEITDPSGFAVQPTGFR